MHQILHQKIIFAQKYGQEPLVELCGILVK